jgi:ADP-heptose:LPS heptosyltransferase
MACPIISRLDFDMPKNASASAINSSCSTAAVAARKGAMISKAAAMSIPVRRILTIHPNGLENLIFTLPALHALRESFPGARIGSVIPGSLQSLMEESPDVDDILARRHHGISSQTTLWVKLREQHFDMAICFSTSRHATLMAFASGAAVRAGFAGARLGRLLTQQVSKESPASVDTYLELAQSLGCRICEHSYRDLLPLSPQGIQAADAMIAERGIESTFAVICLAKSTFTAQPKLWEETISILAAKMPVVIVGINPVNNLPGILPVSDFSGKTEMPILAALCARAEVCLGNDSGILHLAACVGTPVVEIDDSADGRLQPVRGVPYRLCSANQLQPEEVLKALDEVRHMR